MIEIAIVIIIEIALVLIIQYVVIYLLLKNNTFDSYLELYLSFVPVIGLFILARKLD